MTRALGEKLGPACEIEADESDEHNFHLSRPGVTA
jgi:hypothetical protein